MLKDTTVTNLRRLDLSLNHSGPAGVAQVAHSAALQGLEELDLSGTQPTRTGFDLLAKAHFPKLRRLALRSNLIGVVAVRILMKLDLMNRLSELDLRHNSIGGSGGTAVLLEQAGFDSLDLLDLRGNHIADRPAVRKRFGKRVRV
jgi:Leucine-rich repeat (LRR) protein